MARPFLALYALSPAIAASLPQAGHMTHLGASTFSLKFLKLLMDSRDPVLAGTKAQKAGSRCSTKSCKAIGAVARGALGLQGFGTAFPVPPNCSIL